MFLPRFSATLTPIAKLVESTWFVRLTDLLLDCWLQAIAKDAIAIVNNFAFILIYTYKFNFKNQSSKWTNICSSSSFTVG